MMGLPFVVCTSCREPTIKVDPNQQGGRARMVVTGLVNCKIGSKSNVTFHLASDHTLGGLNPRDIKPFSVKGFATLPSSVPGNKYFSLIGKPVQTPYEEITFTQYFAVLTSHVVGEMDVNITGKLTTGGGIDESQAVELNCSD